MKIENMTMRDYLAANASEEDIKAQAEVIRSSSTLGILPDGWRVVARYMHADAMLAAREAVKPDEQPASEVLSDDLSKCQRALMDAGKPYPKTCPVCGLGGKCKLGCGAGEDHEEDCSQAASDLTEIRKQRDCSWEEAKAIRQAINANHEESTLDEVVRVVAQRDELLSSAEYALEWMLQNGLEYKTSAVGNLRRVISSVKGGAA